MDTPRHGLGITHAKAGEIITFTFTEKHQPKQVTVVAIADIDISREMAIFIESIDRTQRTIFTEEALPAFIEHLSNKSLIHMGSSVVIEVGQVGRPARRLLDEHRFSINPEAFWDDKISHRYHHSSFTVFTQQDHTLTILAGVEAPFYVQATVMDMDGELLGMLTLSVLSDNKHTLLNDEDIERIRLALQADISLSIPEISVVIPEVRIIGNPDYGSQRFAKHFDTREIELDAQQHYTDIEDPESFIVTSG